MERCYFLVADGKSKVSLRWLLHLAAWIKTESVAYKLLLGNLGLALSSCPSVRSFNLFVKRCAISPCFPVYYLSSRFSFFGLLWIATCEYHLLPLEIAVRLKAHGWHPYKQLIAWANGKRMSHNENIIIICVFSQSCILWCVDLKP